jgi:hypothetical protein
VDKRLFWFNASRLKGESLWCGPLRRSGNPGFGDGQVQAFFNGIAIDQQLAEQYFAPATPAPQLVATPQAAAAPAALSDAASLQLEADLDAAIAEDGKAVVAETRTTIAELPPSPLQTVLLVLASLGLLAFAATVLTLAIRELRKDAKQRKRTYRRRVKRRPTSTPAHAS